MTRKIILTIARTGGMASKAQNPALPVTPDEIAADVQAYWELGASVVALNARPDGEATCDPAIYGAINRKICDRGDIVINNSTGSGVIGDMIGQGGNGYWEILWEQRLKGVEAGAEICTLDATTIIASFGGRDFAHAHLPRTVR
jgi:uncharacterized protein (DUF849 family)